MYPEKLETGFQAHWKYVDRKLSTFNSVF